MLTLKEMRMANEDLVTKLFRLDGTAFEFLESPNRNIEQRQANAFLSHFRMPSELSGSLRPL
jgi:hypothetical protein